MICPTAKNIALQHYDKLFDPNVAMFIATFYSDDNNSLHGDVPTDVVKAAIENGAAKTNKGMVDLGRAITRSMPDGSAKDLHINMYNNKSSNHLPWFIDQMRDLKIPDSMIAQLWAIANGSSYITKYGDWRANHRLIVDTNVYEQSIKPALEVIDAYESSDTHTEEETIEYNNSKSEVEYLSSRYGITNEEDYQAAREILDNLPESAFKNFTPYSEPRVVDLLNEYARLAGSNMFDVASFNKFITDVLGDKLGSDMVSKTIEDKLLDPDVALYVQIYNSVNTKAPIIIKSSDSLENKRNILTALQNKKLGAFIPGGIVSKHKFAETDRSYLYSVPKVNTEANIYQNITEGVSKEAGRTKNDAAFSMLSKYVKANGLYWLRLHETPNAYTVAVDKEVIDGPGKSAGFEGQQMSLAFQLDAPKRKAAPKNKVLQVARRLSEVTGIQFTTMSKAEAADIMRARGQVNTDAIAFYDSETGTVVFINDAEWSEDTPFHEFIHPFIDVVEAKNPVLMASLWKQLQSDSRGAEIIEEVKRSRPELVNGDGTLCTLGMKEALTQLLGEMSANKLNEAEHKGLFSKIRTFFKSLAKFFSRFSHREINPEELSESTTLSNIAEMFGLADQPIKLFTIENGLQFQTDSGNYHLAGETLVKMKIEIHKQIEAIKRSKEKNKDKLYAQLVGLEGMLRDINNTAFAVSNMAVNAFETLTEVHSNMAQLAEMVNSPEVLENPDTAKAVLDALTFYKNVADAYNWVKDLKLDIQSTTPIEGFKDSSKGMMTDQGDMREETAEVRTPMEFLSKADTAHESINRMYNKIYKNALSGIVFPTIQQAMLASDKQFNDRVNALEALIAEKERDGKKATSLKKQLADLRKEKNDAIATDVQEFVRLMTIQRKDVTWSEFQLGVMSRSRDTVLAAFATYIKRQADLAKRDTVKNATTLTDIWNRFRPKATANRSNVAKFNGDVIERISKYETVYEAGGKRKTVKRDYMAFVQEYDVSKYEEARNAAMEQIETEERAKFNNPTATEQSLIKDNINKRKAKWYKENTEPLSKQERDAVKEWKREVLPTEEMYDEWLNKVENQWGFSGELTRPKIDKFPNAKWNSLYKNTSSVDGVYNWVPISDAGKYHQQMLAEYKKLQDNYPPQYRRGNILPSVRKSTTDKLYENGPVNFAKGWYEETFKRIDADDYRYGKDSADTESGKVAPERHRIPIFFTHYMEADDVSVDLLSSLTLFAKEANHYRRMYDIKGEIDAMHRVMATQDVVQTDAKGNKMPTKAANKFNKIMTKYSVEDYAKKEGGSNREAWFEAFMDMQVYGRRRVEQHVMGINVDKVVDGMMSFMAKTQLGGANVLKHVANSLQAHIQMSIEAYGNENFGRKSMATAGLDVAAGMPGLLKDFATAAPRPTSFLGQLAQEYDIIQGRLEESFGGSSHSFGSNAITGKYWMVGMEAGETYNQLQLGIALMRSTTVKQNGKDISLYDAHEQVDGKLRLKEGVEFSESQKQAFINKLRALNEDLNGVYNQFDEPTAKRFALGRMVLLYRNFIYATFKRRYTQTRVDLMTGETMEGYYVTTFNIIKSRFKELAFLIGGDSSLTPKEKANVRKTMAELLHAMVLMVLVAVLKARDDDDDDKNWMYDAMLYEIVRAKSETAFMIPILGTKDVMRTLATPTVASTSIERLGSLLTQVIYDPAGVYERDYGFADKGDNKAWIKAKRLVGITGLNLNPKAAVQYYLRTY